jgi:hypothetical protein
VLAATGYRHYGAARSIAVAVVVVAIALVISWVSSVFVVASALGGTATSVTMGIVLYGVPAAVVVILGLLAHRLVPGRSAADQSFDRVSAG